MKGKIVIIGIIILVVAGFGVVGGYFMNRKLPKKASDFFDTERVTSIMITDGNTGQEYIIEERSEINDYISILNSMTFKYEKAKSKSRGWSYSIAAMEGNKVYCDFEFEDNSRCVIKNSQYMVSNGEFDKLENKFGLLFQENIF